MVDDLSDRKLLIPIANGYYELTHDLSPLYNLQHLKSININESGLPAIKDSALLDVSRFGSIQEVNSNHCFVKGFEDAISLKSFMVRHYKSKSKSLHELHKLKELDTIYLLFPNIKDAGGNRKFP